MTSYKIDEIGEMNYLTNLHCFCSSKVFEIANYNVIICINSTDKDEAQKLHPHIHLTLKMISLFDKKAKKKLKSLHNPTDKELEKITIDHIDFYLNKEFDFLYNLPEGYPIEYLSIKHSEDGTIIDSGGGNY